MLRILSAKANIGPPVQGPPKPWGPNSPKAILRPIPNGVKMNLSTRMMSNNGPVKNTTVPNKIPPTKVFKIDLFMLFVFYFFKILFGIYRKTEIGDNYFKELEKYFIANYSD